MDSAASSDRSPTSGGGGFSAEMVMTAMPASLGWICSLFFFSGISGLLYQVVWLRILTRILGSTTYATSAVLAAFMAGLALGSWLAGRYVDRVRRPLRAYALLEVGIGLTALATLALPEQLLPLYRIIYDFAGGDRLWLTIGQVCLTLALLLLPTALMGATLPTLCAFGTRNQPDFRRCVGFLYSLNTLGALVGVCAGGFVLLGAYGETLTLTVGVVLNLLVAIAAWFGSRAAPTAPPTTIQARDTAPVYPVRFRQPILCTFAVSGLVALGSEVVWSRMLLLYQGTSIYAFSSMLGVVLGGIGFGSLIGGSRLLGRGDPLRQLARVQIGIALATLIALHVFRYLPTGMLLPPLIVLTPLGILWGVSFPLAVACYESTQKRVGQTIGTAYAWNTVGCIAGSLAAGFVLIPLVGCSRTLSILAGLSLLPALWLLFASPQRGSGQRRGEFFAAAACMALIVVVGDPYFDVLRTEMLDRYPTGIDIHSHTEEATATTTVFGATGAHATEKQLWVNGNGVTHLAPVTKLMAHLPLALADQPRDVLVLCMGMGTSLRSACTHPDVRVRVVELVPAVTRAFEYFHPGSEELLRRPNVELVVDDGRNDLLMHPDKLYDVITLDPPPPLYSAGTVNLYSRDFLLLCRRQLRPRGVLCVYIQPDSLSENRMLFRTFLDVFEHVHVWTNPGKDRGYLMIATLEPLEMSRVPAKIRRLYDNPAIAADLREWGDVFDRPEKILDLYVSDGDALRAACADAPIVTDDRPFTEFPLWRMLQASGEYHTMINATPYKQQGSYFDPYR